MNLLFVAAVLPPFCVLTAWAIVTGLRLYFPERPLPFGYDPVWFHQHAQERSGALVGARDIRDEYRRSMRSGSDERYSYGFGAPRGHIPEAWGRELWSRRN